MTLPAVTGYDYRPAAEWTRDELDGLMGSVTPRVATPRRLDLKTHGPILSALDDVAGFEFFQWQRNVADLLGEVRADGKWQRRVCLVCVARQNGKTTLAARRILAGLFVFGDFHILHTAADRAVPRTVFEEIAGMIDQSPTLQRQVRSVRWANGQESVSLRDGSWYRVVAPNQATVRGYPKVGLVVLDETREHRDDALWSAILYCQRAHPNPQVLTVSNAGDPDSLVLNRLRDRGRAAAEDPEADPSMAYAEWSAPEAAAVDDPQYWPAANPSLGRLIYGSALLEELRTDTPERFRTEALCQWVDVTSRHAIPWAEWVACADRELPDFEPGSQRVWAAIDLDPERSAAALLVGTWHEGRAIVAVVDSWAPASEADVARGVDAFMAEWGAATIAYDPYTCAGVVKRCGGTDGYNWLPVTGAKWVAASAELGDLVRQETLAHADQPVLNEQIAAAGRRDVGDGTWRMSRLDSGVPIPAAIALARLVYAMLEDQGAPSIVVLG